MRIIAYDRFKPGVVIVFELATVEDTKRYVADVKPSFLRDSPRFDVVPEIAPRASEAIVDKITQTDVANASALLRAHTPR